MPILLLDDSLKVDVFFDPDDSDFDDNICMSLAESCPEDEKILCAEQVEIYLTAPQARQLGMALIQAAEQSRDQSES